MVRKLHDMGMTSEHAYMMGTASVGLSFVSWLASLGAESKPRADRWGIFVGMWAPTFISLGNGLRSYEH